MVVKLMPLIMWPLGDPKKKLPPVFGFWGVVLCKRKKKVEGVCNKAVGNSKKINSLKHLSSRLHVTNNWLACFNGFSSCIRWRRKDHADSYVVRRNHPLVSYIYIYIYLVKS
eukprot:TRINITY_DN28537_c1_g1_i1.p1 TRINITY_DN28537_c1_g1~~TRINITY_DN28537_c1_g1_i1.p1  ORF type:complete len:112 (-),score=6.67 TRINITY_DN28537_c1_g1_i1:561-896(-)